jgi:hypothetical protein
MGLLGLLQGQLYLFFRSWLTFRCSKINDLSAAALLTVALPPCCVILGSCWRSARELPTVFWDVTFAYQGNHEGKDRGFLRNVVTSYQIARCYTAVILAWKGNLWVIHWVGRAIAQAVSRRLPTATAGVRARVWSSGICGGRSGTGAGFLRVLRFPLSIFIPLIASQSPSYHLRDWVGSDLRIGHILRTNKWRITSELTLLKWTLE